MFDSFLAFAGSLIRVVPSWARDPMRCLIYCFVLPFWIVSDIFQIGLECVGLGSALASRVSPVCAVIASAIFAASLYMGGSATAAGNDAVCSFMLPIYELCSFTNGLLSVGAAFVRLLGAVTVLAAGHPVKSVLLIAAIGRFGRHFA